MTTIVGAGLAGLIAANLIKDASVVEASESIPNNHSAVLRFRSSLVGDALDIPFTKVKMLKGMLPWRNPIADQLSYAYKCTGTATIRSSVTADMTLQDRWIAPDRFIEILANGNKRIAFGIDWNVFDYDNHTKNIISTIPMPQLMKMLKWKDIPEFKYVHGFNINCILSNVDAYVTLYVPGDKSYNRVSLTGNRLTIEYSRPFHNDCEEQISKVKISDHVDQALDDLGLSWQGVIISNEEIKLQKYSKILPIDEDIRKHFILWATEKYGIYSLGRFATWRPGLMLDDLVNDVRVIKRLISGKSSYDYRR